MRLYNYLKEGAVIKSANAEQMSYQRRILIIQK